jgi:hypothetical protein
MSQVFSDAEFEETLNAIKCRCGEVRDGSDMAGSVGTCERVVIMLLVKFRNFVNSVCDIAF